MAQSGRVKKQSAENRRFPLEAEGEIEEHTQTYTLTHHGIQELDAASQFRSRLAELSEEQAANRLPLTQADVVPLCGGRRDLHVMTGQLSVTSDLAVRAFSEVLCGFSPKDGRGRHVYMRRKALLSS